MSASATYVPIATYSSTSNTSFTFTSIPQTYTDLVLIGNARGVSANTVEYLLIKVNTFTGNTGYVSLNGNGTSATSVHNSPSGTGTWAYLGLIPSANSPSGIVAAITCNFFNYSNSTTYKTYLSRNASDQNNSSNGVSEQFAGMFQTTSPITSISIQGSNGTVGAFTLYGIAAA
jgi:hypothetical protein